MAEKTGLFRKLCECGRYERVSCYCRKEVKVVNSGRCSMSESKIELVSANLGGCEMLEMDVGYESHIQI